MTDRGAALAIVSKHSRVLVEFGAGKLSELGALVRDTGGLHVLLVSDRGIVAAGHVAAAKASLTDAGVETVLFAGVEENPTTKHVEAGVRAARAAEAKGQPIDLIVGLGGGSALDCAKGINFLLTNG